jgi:phosphoribosylanthranilate isomerase
MSLKTEVKVGNISNLSDARYCAGMGVQYLGFSMDSNSDQYVDQNTLKTIKEWIVGPKIVGEFSKIDPDSEIYSSLEEELDYIEITDPDSIDVAEKTGIPVILKLDITNIKSIPGLSEILDNLNNRVQFFLLDGFPGPDIKNMDILNLSSQYRIMIGFKMDQQSIHAWIDGTNIFGISLKGGKEIKPGFKDYDELADILEEIEVD